MLFEIIAQTFQARWRSCLVLATLVGCSTTTSLHAPPGGSGASIGLEEISIQAIALIDTPYRYGGNTPNSGFDCSGLIGYVVDRALSLRLPRTVKQIALKSRLLRENDLAPGDLVFFATNRGDPYSHAGIYVGQGRFVHAPATGGRVRLEELSTPYWAKRFTEARRLDL